MPWQFLVVDGADRDQVFLLPQKGAVIIGGSKKHADICLHDLYVQRTHCEVEVLEDDTVSVRNLRPVEGIFVNKARAEQQALNAGDVLRIGNTHLRLLPATEAGATPPPREEDAPEEPESAAEVKPAGRGPLPTLPPERLGELLGHTLGQYQLNELLAQASHKAVFLATAQKTGETVVVKVLSPRFPGRPEELQRFSETMRKALHLTHESLVQWRGVGKTGPYVWMVREYVPGESLASILAKLAAGKKKLNWQSGLRLARQIGQALDFLHEHHLMHGHLTAGGILVNVEAKQNKLANLLLDIAIFGSQVGIAMRATRRERDVYWFSPEQCEKGAFVDDLSDQYSLGALVYARMTGRPPFTAATVEATMELIRTGPLVRPRSLNPQIPAKFEAIVLRMLSRHQENRYLNPAALLAELDALNS